jgi:argininosuccinate lyase
MLKPSQDAAARGWEAIALVVTAHTVMLREVAILDDPTAAAILSAVDGVSRASPPDVSGLQAAVVGFDERLDALTRVGAVAAGAVGRGRMEVAATAIRLVVRAELLTLAGRANAARRALLDLASDHVFTLMPAHADGEPVQPTTWAHLLGGAISPLARLVRRLRTAFAEANRSPLGSVALASTGLPIERERTAALLAFDGPIANTFDAITAVDHLTDAAEVVNNVAATIRRLLSELLIWRRTDPTSLRFTEPWLGAVDPALPGFRPAVGVDRLIVFARQVEADADAVRRLTLDAPYGPDEAVRDVVFDRLVTAIGDAATLAARTADLVDHGIEVNRAVLANRAGRDLMTGGELADYLMVEAALDPALARNIALLTVRKAQDDGLEAARITPAMIDAAALLVIGRELGVEIEHLGRIFAPRRVIERRTATGAPAPDATRDYLELERTRLLADERWREEASGRIAAAAASLRRAADEIVAGVGN